MCLFHPLISDDDGIINSMDISFSKLQEIVRDRKPGVLHPGSQRCGHSLETELQFSCSFLSDSLWPHGLQHTRLPCPSPAPGACSKTCLLSWWYHPTISSSVVPLYSCLRSFPASGSFPMSQFFASGGRSVGVSVLASVFPMNIQDWFPLGLTGWVYLQSRELSRVFSNTTVQKHQFFSAQLSL